MKSLQHFANQPAGTPVFADDVLEFHAARLLLLFKFCGTSNRIDGLTKMAKLDFFVRYPQFFVEVCQFLGIQSASTAPPSSVESNMVRFHYGPWDQRYYHILSYLEAKDLLKVEPHGNTYRFTLTPLGQEIATRVAAAPAYSELIGHMKQVKQALGAKAGNTLKNLVYTVFGKEVAERPLGETIE